MDVVKETKPREMAIMHKYQAEQNGSQTVVDEVASPVVPEKEIESSSSTPQEDEVPQVVEAAKCSGIERKLRCSEEASVDVHSEDSDTTKTVSVVDHALLQKSSDEFAGVVEAEPTRWSHEVSVDVVIPDEWVDVEMHSDLEPEASTSGILAETPSKNLVCVEPVDRNLTPEPEAAPSAIGASPVLEKQGRELVLSQSVGVEELSTGTEREMVFENRKSMNLLPGSVEGEANHSNEGDPGTTGTTDLEEELESTSSPPKQSDTREQVQRIWSLKNLKKRPLVEPRTAIGQAARPVKPKAPTVVGLPWPPTPLISAHESAGASTDTIVAEPLESCASSPSEQWQGMDIKEQQHLRRLWSLKHLKTRPVMGETGTVTDQLTLKPVKLTAPKVVGLSWPPAPLITVPGINGVFT